MTETERETAGAVRSTHVAHFFPPDWAQTAQRASGALERADRELAAPQLIVTVPDSVAAMALARELRALPATVGLRVVPVTNATRGARLIKAAPPQVAGQRPGLNASRRGAWFRRDPTGGRIATSLGKPSTRFWVRGRLYRPWLAMAV